MFTKKQNFVLFLLIFSGFLLALKLFHIDYMVNHSGEFYRSFCNISDTFNCDAVAASPYSYIFGVPVAFVGTSANFFLLIFLFFGPLLNHISHVMKAIYLYIFAAYTLGCITLALISFIFVPSLCFVCMIYWAVSIATFIYLLFISDGIWKKPFSTLKKILKALYAHKFVITFLLALFVASNAYTGWRLSFCGCHKKGSAALQCENYDVMAETAFLGKKGAKVDVVVYTDFECPWCRRAHHGVLDMMKQYEKQVRFVRKDFPLDMECNPQIQRPYHLASCQAAYFAKCAGRQGKYWEYHDEAYEQQAYLTPNLLRNIAKMLQLDTVSLENCVNSPEIKASVRHDIDEALIYQVTATPSFRIFAEVFGGMIEPGVLNDYLDIYPAISPRVVKRILANGKKDFFQIIDLRGAEAFKQGHIEGAVNMTFDQLGSFREKGLDASLPTLIYDCNEEHTYKAFEFLESRGFTQIRSLQGGWKGFNGKSVQSQVIREVSAEEVVKLIGEEKIRFILDLRTTEDFARSHIKGAKHIPIDELEARIDEIVPFKNEEILIYCRTVNKSRMAVDFLRRQGLRNMVVLEGGMVEWTEKGLPVEN